MDFLDAVEKLLLVAGGAVGLQLLEWLRERSRQRGQVQEKKVVDETEFTRILFDQNQRRYEAMVTELETVKSKVDEMITNITALSIENAHLRYLCGIGIDDPIPTSRGDIEAWRCRIAIPHVSTPIDAIED
jgi:hypothetical protein